MNLIKLSSDLIRFKSVTPNSAGSLEFIEKITPDSPAIFLLKDFNRFLNDVSISRKLKNLIRILKTQPKTLIIVAPDVSIPSEFTDTFTILEFQLPQLNEIKQELDRLIGSLNQKIDNDKSPKQESALGSIGLKPKLQN